jgi:hypothetical protein
LTPAEIVDTQVSLTDPSLAAHRRLASRRMRAQAVTQFVYVRFIIAPASTRTLTGGEYALDFVQVLATPSLGFAASISSNLHVDPLFSTNIIIYTTPTATLAPTPTAGSSTIILISQQQQQVHHTTTSESKTQHALMITAIVVVSLTVIIARAFVLDRCGLLKRHKPRSSAVADAKKKPVFASPSNASAAQRAKTLGDNTSAEIEEEQNQQRQNQLTPLLSPFIKGE